VIKLIETKTLASATTSLSFTSIPQTFTDLYVLVSSRNGAVQEHLTVAFNGSTANFTGRFFTGSTSVASGNYARYLGNQMSSSSPGNTFSNGSVYITNYRVSSSKAVSSEISGWRGDTNVLIGTLTGNLWNNTAAITSMEFTNEASSNISAGTTFSLYGITAGSDGTTVVS
jgi:hypothetical protein